MIKDDSPLAGSGDLPDPLQRVRLIDTNGKQLGIMTLSEARTFAQNQQAQLVKIASNITPPIYRLIEADKHKRWSM